MRVRPRSLPQCACALLLCDGQICLCFCSICLRVCIHTYTSHLSFSCAESLPVLFFIFFFRCSRQAACFACDSLCGRLAAAIIGTHESSASSHANRTDTHQPQTSACKVHATTRGKSQKKNTNTKCTTSLSIMSMGEATPFVNFADKYASQNH